MNAADHQHPARRPETRHSEARHAQPEAGHAEADRFGITVACWGARWRIQVRGELDAAGASAIVDIAEVLAGRRAPAVDLDLSEVTRIETVGWQAAAYAETLLVASGADCRLVSPPSPLVHPARRPSAAAA